MKYVILNSLKGMSINRLMGLYFRSVDGYVGQPIAVVYWNDSNGFTEITSDGNGGIRVGHDPLGRLFFDVAYGFSFIAPLLVSFEGQLDGSEIIEEASVDCGQNLTVIKFRLNTLRSILMRLENDELAVSLDS